MDYLGQHIELHEEPSGWVAIWWHQLGLIHIGYFTTASEAWSTVAELVVREIAVRSLLEVAEDWRETALIDDWEYAMSVNALVQYVLA